MADVHLPATLPPLFEGLPRRLELEAASVGEAIERLDARWPGLRDRVCEPAAGRQPDPPARASATPATPPGRAGASGARRMTLRPHIRVFVDGERAELDTPLAPDARLDVIAAISGG
jgi:molybdopterin synthase sulfur carrier subunit